jgi:hypothetical protein
MKLQSRAIHIAASHGEKNARLRSRFIVILLTLAVLLFAWGGPTVSAQLSSANITGAVEDITNARIADANVKLINSLTGTENDSTSGRFGVFVLAGVLPGTYTLQVERKGFATIQVTGLVLNVGDNRNFLVRMKVGSVAETVTVDAAGLAFNTSDASVSTVVDRKFVGNVPLNGRSFQDLISMTPGVNTQTPQAAGQTASGRGDFSANGQGTEANTYTVDGVSANIGSSLETKAPRIPNTGSVGGSTALGTTQSLISVDALQEFRVLTSTYPAEYGRTPGAQFTLLTRSGTNAIHGSAYDYLRNHIFDAGDWFVADSQEYRPSFHQNDFGGTLGGPVILPGLYDGRDKTFFFASYEGLRLAQPTPETIQYGYFLHTFPPAPVRAVLGNMAGDFDAPAGTPGLTPVFFDAFSLPSRVNSTSVRIDQTFSPRLSMFFRYSQTPSYSETRQLTSLTASQNNSQTYTFGVNDQLSPTKVNEFRFGYAASSSRLDTTIDGNFVSDPTIGLNTAVGLGAYPQASADAYIRIAGIGESEAYTDHATAGFDQWNLRDTFSLQVRNHFFKLGFDERHIVSSLTPAPLSVSVSYYDTQSMFTNQASNITVTQSQPARPVLNEFSAYAQDEWRASKALTLSMGLRWEINPAPHGQHGQDAYTALGDVQSPGLLTVAPRGTSLWNTSWYNLAPRLGVAWIAHSTPGTETIVRSGVGVFFDTPHQDEAAAFTGLGFTTFRSQTNAPVPVPASELSFSDSVGPPYTQSIVYAFPRHLQLPYSLQWNVSVDQSLGKNQAFTLSYVGVEGHRLLHEQRSYVNQENADFGNVAYFPSGLTSSYQSLQLKYQRSLAHGVQALGSYVWSHTLDYGSPAPELPLTYSNSDFDVRHNLEAALSWDLPSPRGHSLPHLLAEGWGTDARLIARTGYPITMLGNLLSEPASGTRYYSGVDLASGRPLFLHGSQFPGGRMLNGGPNAANPAFVLPSGSATGDAARNFVRGFGTTQVNFAVRREFPLHDQLDLQFRAEAFNVLNHPSFGYVDPHLTDALFGQSTRMLNQSFGPTGSLYQQGGPRSIQFSLKLSF